MVDMDDSRIRAEFSLQEMSEVLTGAPPVIRLFFSSCPMSDPI